MSKGSERVIKWRALTKKRIIESMGGKCSCCGYDTHENALELHHLDPGQKEFGLGNVRASPMSWERICVELRKCVLVCANCHREVHAGVRTVPVDAPQFNEAYADYKKATKGLRISVCPICAGTKRAEAKTCSLKCAGVMHTRVDWSKYDLHEMARTMSNVEISRIVGVSDVSVSKRLIKLGIRRITRGD